jgi:hypothetical protein
MYNVFFLSKLLSTGASQRAFDAELRQRTKQVGQRSGGNGEREKPLFIPKSGLFIPKASEQASEFGYI